MSSTASTGNLDHVQPPSSHETSYRLEVNMHVSQSRPIGPRNLHPTSQPLTLETTTPLVIRKAPKDPQISPPLSTARSPPPSLSSLSIPNSGNRSSTPKGIKLSIPPRGGSCEYYGGPTGPPLKLSTEAPEDVTIRPQLVLATITQKPSDPIDDISQTLTDISLKTTSPAPKPSVGEAPPQWSDDVLEELSRLGEGAGGAVHRVKDKRTGKIMARKTITTREAPMKQLLRELSIISSTEHVNIILFYGAYVSPSSSEVKILMEYCEGGSLEAVGKRIKERQAVVGEKIAGRLAEGVGAVSQISAVPS
jgi:mitogen-activated protein kinase kinase